MRRGFNAFESTVRTSKREEETRHRTAYFERARQLEKKERSYFDDSEEEEDNGARRAPSSSTADQADEIDPLDAFMMDIQETQKKEKISAPKAGSESAAPNKPKPSRLDVDDVQEDRMVEAYLKKQMREGKSICVGEDSDEEVYRVAKEVEKDSGADFSAQDEGNGPPKAPMETLAPLQHNSISYEPFNKNFYRPHEETKKLSVAEIRDLQRELQVTVYDPSSSGTPLAPVRSFMHAGFHRLILQQLLKQGLESPTPIQSQAFPYALSGRDIIAIAKTGSGKTVAFTLPMVTHVMDQRELQKGEGPIALVLSPTRELAHQIYNQVRKFLKPYGGKATAIYGGASKWEQIQSLTAGVEVVVGTPGRVIEMVRKKSMATQRLTLVVLDEADRMFELGFEAQIRSVLGQIRPDRQTMLFSATFRRRVEALARDTLSRPVRITVGKVGQANEDIKQIPVVLKADVEKWNWLLAHFEAFQDLGRTLVFVSSKVGCEELSANLNRTKEIHTLALHGDKTQQERSEALKAFSEPAGSHRILIATDVAARGLDIKDIKTVVNFDAPKNLETHIHRIGRTGRMGKDGSKPGTAYTLVTLKETQFASVLVNNMDVSKQPVPDNLLQLARKDPRFRRKMTPSHSGVVDHTGTYTGTQPGFNSKSGIERGNTPYNATVDEELEEDNNSFLPRRKVTDRGGIGFQGNGGNGGGKHSRAKWAIPKQDHSVLANSFKNSFVRSAVQRPQNETFQIIKNESCSSTPRSIHNTAATAAAATAAAPVVPTPMADHVQKALAEIQSRIKTQQAVQKQINSQPSKSRHHETIRTTNSSSKRSSRSRNRSRRRNHTRRRSRSSSSFDSDSRSSDSSSASPTRRRSRSRRYRSPSPSPSRDRNRYRRRR